MSTNFPTGLDTFVPYPSPTAKRNNPSLAGRTNDLADAVKALETAVGVTNSLDPTSLQYRVNELENGGGGEAVPPSLNGMLAWNMDIACAFNSTTYNTSGRLNVARFHLVDDATITNLSVVITAAGTSVTASYMALYTAAGALLSQSASGGATPTGLKTFALGSPQALVAGDYYAAFWCLHSGAPQLAAFNAATSQVANAGVSAPNLRWATADTGLTTTAPATIGAQTSTGFAWWVGAS